MKRAILHITALAVLLSLSGFPLMAQVHAGGVPGGGMGHTPGMGQTPGMGHDPQIGHGPMQPGQPGMRNPGINQGPNSRNNMPRMGRIKTPDQLLAQNPKLSSRLKTMLPSGENVMEAANGFKNLGQFVASAEISHNLNIPFDQFKSKVTSGDNLGKAVHALDPTLTRKQVKAQVKKAKHEAKREIKDYRS